MADVSNIKKGPGKRGYILTLVVIMLFSVLALYATNSVSNRQQQRAVLQNQFYAEKASYVLEDVAQDIRYNVLKLDMPANSTQLFLFENLSLNKTTFLPSYASFLQNYSPNMNTNISLGYSDPIGIVFSNGFRYQSNFSNRQIDFYNLSGGPAAVAGYYVSINSSQASSTYSLPSFMANGTFVFVNFTDLAKPSKSFTASGYVDPTVLNQFDIKYSGNNHVYVNIGLIDGRQNSYQMQQVGITALTIHSLAVNRTVKDGLYAAYMLPVNITFPNMNFTGNLPADG